MPFERSSGILLHPTSLPGGYGIGTLGPEAFARHESLERDAKPWIVQKVVLHCFGQFVQNVLHSLAKHVAVGKRFKISRENRTLPPCPCSKTDGHEFVRLACVVIGDSVLVVTAC